MNIAFGFGFLIFFNQKSNQVYHRIKFIFKILWLNE